MAGPRFLGTPPIATRMSFVIVLGARDDQYRICFEWAGSDARNVEIVDYH